VIAYLAARAVNIASWLRAGLREPVFRPVALRFALGLVVVAVVLGFGLASSDPTLRVVLWAVAVVLDIATPFATVAALSNELSAISSSKFPERFGLLTMIVLGESVTGVLSGVSGLHDAGRLTPAGVVQGLLGSCVGFALAWTYYDFIARRPPRPAILTALGWVHLHMIVIIAVAATGAGISAAIAASAGGGLDTPARLLLTGAVAVALVAIAALETTLARGPDEFTHPRWSPGLKLGAAAAVAALGALSSSTTALLAMVLAGLLVPVVYGVTAWAMATPTDTAAPAQTATPAQTASPAETATSTASPDPRAWPVPRIRPTADAHPGAEK